jgi:hypothetical protein
MVTSRIRCQVLEIPTQEDWSSRRGRPKDLLPWADPYIAGLVRKLEERFDAPAEWEGVGGRGSGGGGRGERVGWSSAGPVSQGLTDLHSDPASDDCDAFDDGWQEDAFMPRPLEEPRFHCYPPVVGGFPLLEE